VFSLLLAPQPAVIRSGSNVILTYLSTAQGGIHKHAYGYVTVATTGGGCADVTVQLEHGAKSYTYVVKSYEIVRGTFTTDIQGNGVLKFSFAPSQGDPYLGHWINIWESDGGLSPTGVYEPSHLLLCAYQTLVP
jgi:hypothetical protein